jgi:hypothetical protein
MALDPRRCRGVRDDLAPAGLKVGMPLPMLHFRVGDKVLLPRLGCASHWPSLHLLLHLPLVYAPLDVGVVRGVSFFPAVVGMSLLASISSLSCPPSFGLRHFRSCSLGEKCLLGVWASPLRMGALRLSQTGAAPAFWAHMGCIQGVSVEMRGASNESQLLALCANS